jgi:preprotein translocase subunit YajC
VDETLLKLAGGAALFAVDDAKDAKPGDASSLWQMLFPFVAIFALFYFLMIRPQKREQSRRQAMLSAVKKNDRVVTIGGIYGVVTNVHREADEVTIKVDEATNTKLRVTLSSVSRVLGAEPADEPAKP